MRAAAAATFRTISGCNAPYRVQIGLTTHFFGWLAKNYHMFMRYMLLFYPF
jgi:hypothetical protein